MILNSIQAKLEKLKMLSDQSGDSINGINLEFNIKSKNGIYRKSPDRPMKVLNYMTPKLKLQYY